MEREITFANERNHGLEQEAMESRMQMKKIEKETEELMDKLTDL